MGGKTRLILAACGAVALLAITYGSYHVGYLQGRDRAGSDITYPEGRTLFTRMLAEQFGEADTLVLGDSLVEQTDFTDACGRTFQAGLGGARVAEAKYALELLLERLSPQTIVLAVGTNHFSSKDEYDLMSREYPELVEMIPPERRVILVGLLNSQRGDDFIREYAKRNGHQYIAPPAGPMMADGLHYEAQGARNFCKAVEQACTVAPVVSSSD